MTIGFEHPEWLLLAALILPMAVVGLRWFSTMSRVRRWSAVLVRSLLIALLAGALAGATAVRRTDRLAVIAVVDVSGSVRRLAGADTLSPGGAADPIARVQEFLKTASADRSPDDLLGIVVFGERALALAAPTAADVADRSLDVPVGQGTDIANAIELAASMIPPDAAGRVVLFSDGNATRGDLQRAVQSLGTAADSDDESSSSSSPGIVIDVVPVKYNIQEETMIVRVDAPPAAAEATKITVRITLQSTRGSTGTLRLEREGEQLDINGSAPGLGKHIVIPAGRSIEMVDVELSHEKVHRFRAFYEPDPVVSADGTEALQGDTIIENNTGRAFTITPGQGSILVVDGVSGGAVDGDGAILPRVLRDAGFAVQTVPAEGVLDDLLWLQGFDLVVLENVPADALSQSTRSNLALYVQELGGGLIMVGGPASFGAGGWKGTPIEPILPVKLDLPERLVMPEVAIVIVLDSSGSMGRTVLGSIRTQQQIANEAAALAVRTLDKKDLVGVIEFSNSSHTVVPLGPNVDPDSTAARIRSISPDGGTNLGPALRMAHKQLAGQRAKIKHVIVLSDGQSQASETLSDVTASMLADGISVSTIAVGDGADVQTMDEMAERGGGAFYQVINPEVLPRVFLRAVRVVRSPMIREEPFLPIVPATGSPLTAGLTNVPQLGGLVITQARDEPQITLAMLSPEGEPVLAHWSVGLGQVVAFTSDTSNWARDWLTWNGFTQFWTQVARAASRAASSTAHEAGMKVVDGELTLWLDAYDQSDQPMDMLSVQATVFGPDNEPVSVTLDQTGPGRYTGRSALGADGNYIAVFKPKLGVQHLAPVVGGVAVAQGDEYRVLGSNEDLLTELASQTGGRVIDLAGATQAELFVRQDAKSREARTPIWGLLVLWALAFFMLDVATRRVAWDRFISREFGQGFARWAADAQARDSAGTSRAISALKQRTSAEPDDDSVSIALDDADAKTLAKQARLRRKQARLDSFRHQTHSHSAASDLSTPPSDAQTKPKAQSATDDADEPASGLLAAKRRARERFGDEDESSETS